MKPHPQLSLAFDPHSAIAEDLDTVWDLKKFLKPRAPQKIAALESDTANFSQRNDLRILRNTINPYFNYSWNMQARNVHETLQEYKPLEQCRACGMCVRGRCLQK